MHNTNACKAGGALSAHPEMAEARNLATGRPGLVEEQAERNTRDCAGDSLADQLTLGPVGYAEAALLHLEGASYADAFLERLRAGIAQPDELASVLAFLSGEMLQGACRVIEKALGVRHG